MSGQPNRYAADAAKFRQDYMNSLDLRASLDDQVLQAVKVYKQTGQLPAVSTMQDNRTAEEKLKDTEGLKMQIMAELKPIGDSQFGQAVIQGILNSPLNTSGSLFTFFAQRVSGFVKNLKDIYSIGIKGDSGDVRRFISSIEDFYSKDKAMATTTKSYFDRPTNSTGGISADDLDALRKQYAAMVSRIRAGNHRVNPEAISIENKYNALIDLLNSEFLKRFRNEVLEQGAANNAAPIVPGGPIADLYDAYTLFQDLLAQLPSYSKIFALQKQLDTSIANANPDLSNQIVLKIDEQFPPLQSIVDVTAAIQRYRVRGAPGANARVAPAARNAVAGVQNVNVEPNAPAPVPVAIAHINWALPLPQTSPHHVISQADWRTWATNARDAGAGQANHALAYQLLDLAAGYGQNAQSEHNRTVVRNALRGPGAAGMYPFGAGIMGEKKRRGRPKGSGISKPFIEKVDFSQGVQPSPRYISFGRHLINKKKLNDNILSIKTKTGSNIHNTPVTHISQHMKTVIDKIIGGAIPSYEDLSKLTDEEKSYLHKVAKQSDILDKFSIPAPSKDQEEKEIHEYEVMRGEIMSGNDNKELIKKFKLLIIKLSRRGALPKKEVSDILSELIELGF